MWRIYAMMLSIHLYVCLSRETRTQKRGFLKN